MNKLHLALAVVVGAVVLGSVFMFVGALSSQKDASLGTASVTNSNVLNQARLATEVTNLAAPLQNIGNAVTAAIDFPSVNGSGSSTATSTQVTGLVASLGDLVLIQPNFVTAETSTSFFATVVTASTTNATIGIIEQNGTGAAFDATSTTFDVVTLPFTSFKAVTGL